MVSYRRKNSCESSNSLVSVSLNSSGFYNLTILPSLLPSRILSDAASAYTDENGRIDFFAFAGGVVKELEEEFGPQNFDGFDDASSSASGSSFMDEEFVEGDGKKEERAGGGDSAGRHMSIKTPPIPTDDLFELEDLISKRWKVQHFEKNNQELKWEDYEGTGIRRPSHIVHNFAGMSRRERAAYVYHHHKTPPSRKASSVTMAEKNVKSPRYSSPEMLTNVMSPKAIRSPTFSGSSAGGVANFVGSASAAFSGEGSPEKKKPLGKEDVIFEGGARKPESSVSKLMRKEVEEEKANVATIMEHAEVHIAPEAEELLYKQSALDKDDLSATVLNLSAKLGRSASAAFDDEAVLRRLVDIQQPGGYWKLNAQLCVQLKMKLSDVIKGKPSGCEREFWATELVLTFFSTYYPHQQKVWQLSERVARKWITGKKGVVSQKFDEAVKRRAEMCLRDCLDGGGGLDDALDRYGEDSDFPPQSDGARRPTLLPQAARADADVAKTKELWSSNHVKPELTQEEEHRRKMQIKQWKEVSLDLVAKMTKKVRRQRPEQHWYWRPGFSLYFAPPSSRC